MEPAGSRRRALFVAGANDRSVGLQQPIDVVELFLGPLLAGAAAQLVEDLAALLALELERDLVDAGIDRVAVIAVGAAERVAILGAPLALLDLANVLAVAGTRVAHLLGHVAHALLQIVECATLGARRLARIAATQRILGFAHRALGAAQRLRHRHAVLVQLAHEVAKLVAQALLLAALLLAPLAVARLLAARTFLTLPLLPFLSLLPPLALLPPLPL